MIKELLKKSIFTAYLLLITGYPASSQPDVSKNPAYGSDSETRLECAMELSNLEQFAKINQFEFAMTSWRKVYRICPASSKNIYIIGSRLFTQKLDAAKDEASRNSYYDTLMILYKDRIKYFGEEGYVMGRMGRDILKYHGDDYDKAYYAFKKSILLGMEGTDINILMAFMETSLAMFKVDSITALDFFNDYILECESLNKMSATTSKKAAADNCYNRINEIIKQANIKDCQVIEEAFKERINNEPKNGSLINIVISLMENSDCSNSEFYGQLFEKAVKIDNSADNSYQLAKYYIKKEKFQDAMEQLENAVSKETDPGNKSQYYYQMSVISNAKLNNPKSAVEYAQKAIENKPEWGEPYFQVAFAYIEGIKSCDEDPFIRSAVFWLAVDVCVKARTVDPSVKNRANELITEYSRFFPTKEELFFRSMPDGAEYTISCWINQKTTVRSKS